ncbi:MAG: TrkH family potassium uptake protein [Proteobacteria bacterium]|nr:TrkH family potassium uptake protein [Pseudomonadota bacterium]
MEIKKLLDRFFATPARIFFTVYLTIMFIGGVILYLPFSHTKKITFIDALFTSFSAVSDTGLIVLDTPNDFTLFGKVIILALLQLGGLGYMSFTTFFLLTFGQKISFRDRLILAESLNYPGVSGLIKFIKRVFFFVILFELTGTLLIFISLIKKFDFVEALWLSFFHAVSAFNNAGFSLFSDNLVSFRGDYLVNFTVASLIICGGIGFFVLNEFYLYYKGELNRISTHTKLVLGTSIYLIVFGSIAVLIFEYNNYKGLWQCNWQERILTAFFTSISARTAGFNTIDLSGFTDATLSLISSIMFIGASPGSTGGGIKTTTFAVIILAIYNYIKGSTTINVNFRRINEEQIYKALVIFSISFIYITLVALYLSKLEKITFTQSLFETISAFSTVGLSVGNGGVLSLSANFSNLGKIIIMATMFIGKIGILSFVMSLTSQKKDIRIKSPETKILI